MALELTTTNIDETINEGVSLVDFWAPWCGPCRMIAPIIDELSTEYEGKATIAKVNVDENQDLAQKFGVRGIPTMLFIKNGEVMDTLVGASSKQNIADKINKLIGD